MARNGATLGPVRVFRGRVTTTAAPPDPVLVTVRDAAASLRVSETYARRLIRNGELAAVDLAGRVRVRHEDLVAFAAGLPRVRKADQC